MTSDGWPERGKRAAEVQWGLREIVDGYFHKRGHVEPRDTEAAARRIIEMGRAARYHGWGRVEVVRRTVVTYTTRWETAPVSTVPELLEIPAAGPETALDEFTGPPLRLF